MRKCLMKNRESTDSLPPGGALTLQNVDRIIGATAFDLGPNYTSSGTLLDGLRNSLLNGLEDARNAYLACCALAGRPNERAMHKQIEKLYSSLKRTQAVFRSADEDSLIALLLGPVKERASENQEVRRMQELLRSTDPRIIYFSSTGELEPGLSTEDIRKVLQEWNAATAHLIGFLRSYQNRLNLGNRSSNYKPEIVRQFMRERLPSVNRIRSKSGPEKILATILLTNLYTYTFGARVTLSNDHDTGGGPTVRFIRSALCEMGIRNPKTGAFYTSPEVIELLRWHRRAVNKAAEKATALKAE